MKGRVGQIGRGCGELINIRQQCEKQPFWVRAHCWAPLGALGGGFWRGKIYNRVFYI